MPLTKLPTEKRPTLSVQSARNSLSQWATQTTTAANLRKSRNNCGNDIFSRNIGDLLAERGRFEPSIGSFMGSATSQSDARGKIRSEGNPAPFAR